LRLSEVKKKIERGILVGAAAFLIAFAIQTLHLFRALEWKSWDARLRLMANPERAGKDIVLILVDQYSLDVYRKEQGLSWPWPREIYAYLLRYLKVGGAAACFLDMAMSETSVYKAEDDAILARAMADAGNVFVPIALSAEEMESDEAAVKRLGRFSSKTPVGPPAVTGLTSVAAPLGIFLEAARGVGNVGVNPDGDGIYRRLPLAFGFRDLTLPSVPLALANFVRGTVDLIPKDEAGRMIIRFWGPAGTYRAYPIATLINSWAQMQDGRKPQIPAREFAGKIVLVGLSAVGLHDLKSSPLSAVIPGVEIHAAALDTLLHGPFIRPASPMALSALTFLWALLAGVAASILRKAWLVAGTFLVFPAVPAAAAVLALTAGVWLDVVFPMVAVVLTLIGASVLNYSVEGRQRRFIKNVLHHYLSPAVIERIIETPELLRLGGEEREITSFFSDVAGFTTVAEKLSPHELVGLLNAYLSEMTDIILTAGGTLDKYEGDAIVAFWNAPLDDPGHVLKACRAALACQTKLGHSAAQFERRFGHVLRARIGLNTGPAVVGNMGSSRRFDYTAMGDTVNLAARLESACKFYRVPLLAGESTFARVKDEIVGREVDLVCVSGKTRPVRIYELVGEKSQVSPDGIRAIEIYHRALQSYRDRRWDAAIEGFKTLAGDPLAGLYLDRCLRFEQNPPPADWDRVADLTTK
jgi:adenylate cyclase